MRILHTVALYSPSIGGSQEVIKQISEHLVALGHQVTVATSVDTKRVTDLINGVKIKSFNISGNQVVGMKGEIEEYQQYVLKGKFDIILNYAAQSWTTDALIDILPKIEAKKIIVPCGFSNLKLKNYHNYYQEMKTWINHYDAVIFTSKYYQDYQYIIKYLRIKVLIIGNGASENEFTQLPTKPSIKTLLKIPNNHQLVLNISSHVYSKQHAKAIDIFRRAKISNVSMLIIANSFANPECRDKCHIAAFAFNVNPKRIFDHKKIIVTTLDRKSTLLAYSQSDIFLFPSLLECAPLVLYECLAAGLPFISTAAGNAREIVKISKGGIIYSSDTDASSKLEKLMNNNMLRNKYGQRGRKYWLNHATWQQLTMKYQIIYQQLWTKSA